ncbi:MAG: right-handed parallel beta-helix repeat-containing protein [Clostridia bacterium]|nr:right-handed parallel beta-helix repeat-containing protein [Clostridia bacterium]
MLKVLSVLLSAVLAFGSVEVMGESEMEDSAVEIYVSVQGNDLNDGRVGNAVQSLQRAKELVREYNESSDVIVHVGEGVYPLDETIEFSPEDGGRNGHSVLYEGENATISGGKSIEGWVLFDEEKNIYKAENVDFDFAQLYINGERGVRAKNVPLDDPYSMRMIKAYREETEVDGYVYPANCITVDATLVSDWNNLKDVKLKTLTAWTENVLPVESIEIIGGRGVIKIQKGAEERIFNRPHPDITGYSHEYTVDFICWFENAYEFIDEEGEWYLDKSSGTLYYKPREGEDMANAEVIAPYTETLLSVKGTLDDNVKNLSFTGFTFAHSNWTRPNDEGTVGGQASQYVLTSNLENEITLYRTPSAAVVECGENIEFIRNEFCHLGAAALDYYYGDKGGLVEGNVFYDIAGNGINIGKFTADESTEMHIAYNPEDEREICDGQIIRNNYLTNIGADYEGSVGIAAGYPKNITIEHNTLSNMPYTGISVGFGWTSEDTAMENNKILRNHIHDVCMAVCDGAAIYTLSTQPNSEMAYNYIHDITRKEWFDYGCAGLYLDEQTSGYSVHDNAMFDCPGIWQNQNPSGGNSLSNNGIICDEDIILVSGVEEEYRDILPLEEYPQMPECFEPENEFETKAKVLSTNAPLAIDGDSTTAQSAADGEFIFEIAGTASVTHIVVKKQKNAGGVTGYNYWTDWVLAVGCELQGSLDGDEWETIGVMNTAPDNLTNHLEEVFEIENPKPYKYIRYIRTTTKTSSDYGAWLFPSDCGNRLNLADIDIYVMPQELIPVYTKMDIVATNAPLALDGDTDTAAQADQDGEFLFELSGEEKVSKVVVKKQKYAGGVTQYGYYWPDWIFSVGCEVQGSIDGENWETIGKSNSWPDNTGDIPQEEFDLDEGKAYRYVRYVRTEVKTSSDYGAWLFPLDYGNRLNLAEIEIYTSKTMQNSAVLEIGESSIVASFELPVKGEGDCDACVALYDHDGCLIKLETKRIEDENEQIVIDTENLQYDETKVRAFVWDNNMKPIGYLKQEWA